MISRRRFLEVGGVLAASSALACDRLSPVLLWSNVLPAGPFTGPAGDVVDLPAHLLSRLTYGARPGDYGRLTRMGATPDEAAAAFIEQQLSPETIHDDGVDRALRPMTLLELPVGELYEFKAPVLLDTLTRATLTRALHSERQLHEIMVELWSDHFSIDVSKGDCRWLKAADDRDVIRRHALGSFRALVRASALSPAMLWYLDGRVNQRADPAEQPNENYARELLELHTLGVHGGYDQRDVMEIARALTGWTVRSRNESAFGIGRVEFHPALHDDGEKVVLGQRIAAGGQARDLDDVVEIVCAHPATAHHVATRLCRRFIADDPPVRAVALVSTAFRSSGGDIRATLRVLFATREFREARGTKLKRPFHFIVSALRATDALSDCGPALQDYLVRMGHAPFQYPTPDGYPDDAAPWMTTLLWRWNFAAALTRNHITGTRMDGDGLRERAGDDLSLAAHMLGRRPTPDESRVLAESGDTLSLLIASPHFQRY
ncbi:MAG: DUF1800 domain-containing protein [Gemmatimonadaceae bacterium]